MKRHLAPSTTIIAAVNAGRPFRVLCGRQRLMKPADFPVPDNPLCKQCERAMVKLGGTLPSIPLTEKSFGGNYTLVASNVVPWEYREEWDE